MQALAWILSALFVGPAFAGEYTTFQTIIFQTASMHVSADKVCQLDGVLYHKTAAAVPVEYCEGGSNDRANCKTVLKGLAQPIKSQRDRCSRYESDECVAWVQVPFIQGPAVKVQHYREYNDMIERKNQVSETKFVLPTCKVK